MKQFYTTTLIIGIIVLFVTAFATIAVPPDAYVASTLARAPDEWSIQVDDTLNDRLHGHDVKAELVTALRKRASLEAKMLGALVVPASLVLLTFSIVGLAREKKIQELRKSPQD